MPRQPRGRSANGHGAARVAPGEQGKAADRSKGGALLREANIAMRRPPPAPGGTGPAARLASSSRSSDEHRIGPRSFPRHASRLASVAAPFHPRIGPRAQGVGGHLLCCGSSTMAPHRHPRRASHMAPQASCARPMRVSQPPASAERDRKFASHTTRRAHAGAVHRNPQVCQGCKGRSVISSARARAPPRPQLPQ